MTKISQLPIAPSLSITDLLVTVSNGVTSKVTDQQLATLYNDYIVIPISQVTGLQTALNAIGTNVQNNTYSFALDTGVADAYEVTLSPIPTLTDGLNIYMYSTNVNLTRIPTLQVNALTPVVIKNKGLYKTNPGDIGETISHFVYSASEAAFILQNPVSAAKIATDFPDNRYKYSVSTSIANAYSATTEGLGDFPQPGTSIYVLIDVTNTGPSTINLENAEGVPTGNWAITNHGNALIGGEMKGGVVYEFVFQDVNTWQLMNPAFQPNKRFAGNPNTNVAGELSEFCIDTVNNFLYWCSTAGNAASAVWTKIVV